VKKYQVIMAQVEVRDTGEEISPSWMMTVEATSTKDALDAVSLYFFRHEDDDRPRDIVAVICDGKLVWDGRQG
jgi:hypothetical protein